MNFDNLNSTHNTFAGGIFSTIIYIILITMIVSKTIRVVEYDNPDMNTIQERDEQVMKDSHNYTTMSQFNFHVMRKLSTRHMFIKDPEVMRHLNIYFLYEIADWYKPWDEVYQRYWFDAV